MNISGIAKMAVIAIRTAIAMLALLALAACANAEDKLVLHTAKGDFTFRIEIADTTEERSNGLMFRNELAPDAGMLFDYGHEQEASFWMQNTLIPLDMIFI